MIRRRSLLALPFAAAPLGAVRAQTYPSRPVTIIVPFVAGGTTDIMARLMADRLGAVLGQRFVVENRPGAGGNPGSAAVARAEPDGLTLLMGTVGTHAINASLYAKMPFDPVRDFAPVAFVSGVPNAMIVNPERTPVRTPAEFVEFARTKPGGANMASSGLGTSIHLSGEMFQQRTGLKMTHVPYRGSAPALTDMLSGQVDVMFDNLPSCLGFIQGGQLRALAVTSAARSAALPDVPTLAESGFPDFDASSWFGLFAPRGTPEAITARLNKESLTALATDDLRRRLAELGAEPRPMTPVEFAAFIDAEGVRWAAAVKASGARLE